MDAVKLATAPDDIAGCLPVMLDLRPHLVAADFVSRIETQQTQGYFLAFLKDDGAVVAVAGFRVMDMLSSGKTLYVDDLVTGESSRSRGYGKAMLDWLYARARESGCETFSLDSGTFRTEAHGFYFRERMRITSFHFARKVQPIAS